MGIFGFLVLGLIAGTIARAILPGKVSGGWVVSIICGIIGAIVGGWLASMILNVDLNKSFWDIGTWLGAIVGTLVVLLIWGFITKGRAKA